MEIGGFLSRCWLVYDDCYLDCDLDGDREFGGFGYCIGMDVGGSVVGGCGYCGYDY